MEGPLLTVAIDCEFSGPFSPNHFMVSFGAAAVTLDEVTVGSFFRALEKVNESQKFHPDTKKYFWDKPKNKANLEKWEEIKVHPKKAMEEFVEWLRELGKNYEIMMITDSPTDIVWMNYYLSYVTEQPCLDMIFGEFTNQPYFVKPAYEAVLGRINEDNSDEDIAKKMKFDQPVSGEHDPEDDAKEISLRYVRYLNKKHTKKKIKEKKENSEEKKSE